MATTAIFAEILIVGLEACCWLALVVVGLFGTGWFDPGALHDWGTLSTLLVVAAAYVLGILVDRLADSVHSALRRVWPPVPVEKPAGIATMRQVVQQEGGEELRRFVEYQRSRLRIARATVVNLGLAAPAAGIVLPLRAGASTRDAAVLAAVLAAGAALAQVANRRIELAHLRRISDGYMLLKGKRKDGKIDRAAAIPYRWRGGRLELLVVRTSDGHRWTFPKGRRDREDGSLAETAAREAREEAGVAGSLDGKRLTEFDFPHGDRSLRVAAYLLERRRPGRRRHGADARRERRWASPAELASLLAERREPDAAQELARVVAEAVERIGAPPARRFRRAAGVEAPAAAEIH